MSLSSRFVWSVAILFGVVVAAGCPDTPDPAPPGKDPSETNGGGGSADLDAEKLGQLVAEFNRGAALMEQYRYPDASKAFETVLEAAPDWTAARFNLGLAYLNSAGKTDADKKDAPQGDGGTKDTLESARQMFEMVLESEPNHTHATFSLGMYYQYKGEMQEALDCFEKVYQADSDDPHVAYKFAEALIGVEKHEEALPVLEKLVEENPGFNSGVYRLARQYVRAREREKAMPYFDRFTALRELELQPESFAVAMKYGCAGKYYRVLGADSLPLVREAAPSRRIVFSPDTKSLDAQLQSWNWTGGSVNLPGIAAADINGDGHLDLCLTALNEKGGTALWLNDGSGNFSAAATISDQGVSPCFGDVDNDGDCDLWLGRAGADQLLVNDGKGNFSAGEYEVVAGPDTLTTTARLVDVDCDGDLDFLAFRLAKGEMPLSGDSAAIASSIYNNNTDGSFEDKAEEMELAFPETPVAAVVYDDFEGDYDLDLVVLPVSGGAVAWVNSRAGDFRIADAAATGLDFSGAISATTGDPDKDGDRDLLVFTESGIQLMVNDGSFQFESDEQFAASCGRLGGTGGQFADMDNDGDLDIIVADAHRRDGSRGPALLVNGWPKEGFADAAEADPGIVLAAIQTEGDASCVAADFTGNGNCDLLLAAAGGQPMLIENATTGGHSIQLDLTGKRPKNNTARSNGSAIGARVEVKAASMSQQYFVGGSSGPVAMPPLRVHAGLGDHAKVDWLRMIWPDSVLQAELELAANRVAAIEETPRKETSCPYLFAWDGERFAFVSDFGGVGGLGYFVAPGTYAQPDPTEYVRIPKIEPLDGDYVLQSLTRLEEVTYFDEAKLVAVDHPKDTQVYPNEMMAISAAPPDFELFCVRRPIDPVHAVDHRGVDVTKEVLHIDRQYAGVTDLDPRFRGFAEEHCVELDFGDQLKAISPDARLVLFLHGWVEYAYSSTNYAAGQAGLSTRAPNIEVQRNGQWVEVFHEVGYPAGINHMMALEVTGEILPTDRRIRISSNMELYWDRIFFARHVADASMSLKEVSPRSANLHFRGYPREYSPDGRQPNLSDYANIDRSVGWKLMGGDFTRFGEVAELLHEADDCFAIMGHGEEVTLRFAVDDFGPVPDGHRRTFILKTDSFCKDMNLYTAHPTTVEPLPFHDMTGYPYGPDEQYPDTEKTRRYRTQYNTRRVMAR